MHILILFFSGIGLGLAYIFEKKLAVQKYHPATMVVLVAGVSSLISSPLLLYQFNVANSWMYWLIALASVLAYGIGNLFAFKAYKILDASVVGLITRLNIVFTVIMGMVFLGELYSKQSYFGLILILIGSLTIIYEKGTLRINRGLLFSLVIALGYGLAAVLDKIVLQQFSPFTYIALNNFLVALLFSSVKQARTEAYDLLKRQTKLVLLISLFSAGSWTGFMYVLQFGSVSKVFPIYDSLALVSTVLIGMYVLGEKDKFLQKIVGTIAVILGVFLLG